MKLRPENLLLSLFTGMIALVVSVGGYEIYKSHQYDKWKSNYGVKGDWYEGLTVPSGNAVLMWEYRPKSAAEKWGATIRTNSHGFRDREHEFAKGPGTLRIAFAGDSVTVGIGVDQEKIFVQLFEDIVRKELPTKKIETLNFAVDGYTAIQVMEPITQRALSFQPDIVVYVMCMNDFDMQDASGKKIRYFRKPDSFFLETLDRAWLGFSKFFDRTAYYKHHYRKNGKQVYERIREIKEMLTVRGIEFRIVLMPVFEEGFRAYPLAHMHRELVSTLTGSGLKVTDLLESPLSRGATPRTYAWDPWHLNERGHRQVARLLAADLLAD